MGENGNYEVETLSYKSFAFDCHGPLDNDQVVHPLWRHPRAHVAHVAGKCRLLEKVKP